MGKFNLSIISLLFIILFSISLADQPSIRDLFVLSDIDKKKIEVRFWIFEDNASMFKDAKDDISITYPDGSMKKKNDVSISIPQNGDFAFLKTSVDPVIPWHPNSPNIYQIQLALRSKSGDSMETVFQRFGNWIPGMRKSS